MKQENATRSETILALLLLQGMKGATEAEKALQLNLAGFTAVEIANLLQTNAAVVHQHLYSMRKKKKKK